DAYREQEDSVYWECHDAHQVKSRGLTPQHCTRNNRAAVSETKAPSAETVPERIQRELRDLADAICAFQGERLEAVATAVA
ncbi:MAG TPA: hypothetical protein DEV93_20860, partial [Chloroflexi bacterium]|nr:hypothetical protein [Chloroflexota bacterium]